MEMRTINDNQADRPAAEERIETIDKKIINWFWQMHENTLQLHSGWRSKPTSLSNIINHANGENKGNFFGLWNTNTGCETKKILMELQGLDEITVDSVREAFRQTETKPKRALVLMAPIIVGP